MTRHLGKKRIINGLKARNISRHTKEEPLDITFKVISRALSSNQSMKTLRNANGSDRQFTIFLNPYRINKKFK
jgi:hypothetical protein